MVFIKRIQPISLAKVLGILYALMGLIVGAFVSLFAFIIGSSLSPKGGALFGALFGIGSIMVLPVFYGVLGFVSGVAMAGLYNIVAQWVGGIEVETQK